MKGDSKFLCGRWMKKRPWRKSSRLVLMASSPIIRTDWKRCSLIDSEFSFLFHLHYYSSRIFIQMLQASVSFFSKAQKMGNLPVGSDMQVSVVLFIAKGGTCCRLSENDEHDVWSKEGFNRICNSPADWGLISVCPEAGKETTITKNAHANVFITNNSVSSCFWK